MYRASAGIAFLATEKYAESFSIPILAYPTAIAAAMVEPEPMKGSSTMPRPRGSAARTNWRMNA